MKNARKAGVRGAIALNRLNALNALNALNVLTALTAMTASLGAQAGVHQCGAEGLKSPASQRAHAFLTSIQGSFALGPCQIELSVCDSSLSHEDGSVVGDLVVTDRFGQNFYVSFDFSTVQAARSQTVVLNGQRMMHYEFTERIPDPQSGRTEAYRLEILKSEDLTRIVSLHLGVYSTRLRETYPYLPPGKGYWVICETPRTER